MSIQYKKKPESKSWQESGRTTTYKDRKRSEHIICIICILIITAWIIVGIQQGKITEEHRVNLIFDIIIE